MTDATLSEKELAVKIANKVLDNPFRDPDDDMAVLSRQLLRSLDTPPKPAAIRSAEEWSYEINNNRESIVGGYGGKSQIEIIRAIQHDAQASAKPDGVAVVRQLRDALGYARDSVTVSIPRKSMAEEKDFYDTALAAATAFLKENEE